MTQGLKPFKYGMFVHFIAGESINPDGSKPTDMEDCVKDFDAVRFAEDLSAMGAQYLIFTAWHCRVRTLYPSAVNDRWRPGNSSRRDLLGEIIDAVSAKGIRVILYTHPRDGHDFSPEDRRATGWGEGCETGSQLGGQNGEAVYPVQPLACCAESPANPDRGNFRYETWNRYMKELYTELLERYGSRIAGIYTDGDGPCNSANRREPPFQVVDYLMLRRIVKTKNPGLVIVQNAPAGFFSDDFGIPEAFFEYETAHAENPEVWPACRKALAFTAFRSGWAARFPKSAGAEQVLHLRPENMLKYTIFSASCSEEGGICWAAGPYCTGEWENGVPETMTYVGRNLQRFSESVLRAVPSLSWPTVSGDTLASRNGMFFTSSADRRYEYLHLMQFPDGGAAAIPKAADGAEISVPVSLTEGIRVESFRPEADGYSLRLAGTPDKTDTVIRFQRRNPESYDAPVWVNNTDRRFGYFGEWEYKNLNRSDESALGCFESDYSWSRTARNSIFFAFEGSFLSIFGIRAPGNGRADVYLDKVLAGTVDENAETRETRAECFRSENLCGGWHTLELVLRGDGVFQFDAVKITK